MPTAPSRSPDLPPGTYQLVVWDFPLDHIFYFTTFVVEPATNVDLTDQILMNSWFGNLEGTVFYDTNQNGYRDCVTPACDNAAAGDEVGIDNQNINLRWRDGSIYQGPQSDGPERRIRLQRGLPPLQELHH